MAEPRGDYLNDLVDAQEKLRIGRTLLFELIREGRLPSVKIGRRRLVPQSAIDDYIKAHTVRGAA